jgi:hypothetical protein
MILDGLSHEGAKVKTPARQPHHATADPQRCAGAFRAIAHHRAAVAEPAAGQRLHPPPVFHRIRAGVLAEHHGPLMLHRDVPAIRMHRSQALSAELRRITSRMKPVTATCARFIGTYSPVAESGRLMPSRENSNVSRSHLASVRRD